MSRPPLNDSSQELFFSNMSSTPVPPPPPPPSPDPLRPRTTRPPETADQPLETLGSQAPPTTPRPIPPPPPPLAGAAKIASVSTGSVRDLPVPSARSRAPGPARPVASADSDSEPAGRLSPAVSADDALRGRMKLIKLRRARRWAWLRKIPGYKALEALWLQATKVQDPQESSEEQRKRALPAWLVSFVVHVGLILVLALIPLAQMATSRVELIIGDFNGEGAVEFSLAPEGTDISLQEIDLPMSTALSNMPELELSVPAITPSLSPAKATEELGANLAGMAIERGLAGRSGSLKGALLAKFGGNATTEAAVQAGLKWLKYHQLPDGGWSLVRPYNNGAVNEDRTAATAMALNAFLGAGHTHKSGEYQDVVKRGLAFLVKRQDKEGFFANDAPSHNQMYSQALATITVCEAYGLTSDSELKTIAARAIKFAEWSQGRQKGWRYEPREDSDLSVTGWYMMALMTGKMAGLEPSEKVIKSVGDYLDSVQHDYGARYAYQRSEPPSLSMTAEGLLCRQYLGWPKSHPALLRAIELDLLPNAPSAEEPGYSVYFWYYATQVLHHVGGKHWDAWNEKMRVAIPALQVKKEPEVGSWNPDDDQFGASGGRLYTTCFCIYCLEVYYRHLSLYDIDPASLRPSKTEADE